MEVLGARDTEPKPEADGKRREPSAVATLKQSRCGRSGYRERRGRETDERSRNHGRRWAPLEGAGHRSYPDVVLGPRPAWDSWGLLEAPRGGVRSMGTL